MRRTDVIPGQLQEINQKENWNGLEKYTSRGYILAKKFQKQRKTSWIPVYFPSYFRALNPGHYRKTNIRCSELVSGKVERRMLHGATERQMLKYGA